MKYSIFFLFFFTNLYCQNIDRDYIESYKKTIQDSLYLDYSLEMYEGFYKKKYHFFSKPYSGSVIRNNKDEIVYIDEIFGNFKLTYEIYYLNNIPIYIILFKKSEKKKKIINEIYYINKQYISSKSNRKYPVNNKIDHAYYLLQYNKKAFQN